MHPQTTPNHRPRLLDLFAGAGGCSVGYARAGWDVTGVDIAPHADYPYELVVADAIAVLDTPWFLDRFDAIHASPPCQANTTMSNRYRGKGGPTDDLINLIPDVRYRLQRSGKPYVIENVPGARKHMTGAYTLNGAMFGLRVNRPRLFETNWLYVPPMSQLPRGDVLGIYGRSPDGRRLWTRKDGTHQRAARSLEEGAAAMGIDWMTQWEDITEAIPPAYTEHLGIQLHAHIRAQAVAA